MNFEINIDHNNKLIHYKHSGNLKVEDIGKAWDKLLQMKEFTELKYNLFSDYTNAIYDLDADNIDKIVEILIPLKEILYNKKQVLLLSDPTSTALALAFEEDVNKKVGFRTKVFTTKKAALRWILA